MKTNTPNEDLSSENELSLPMPPNIEEHDSLEAYVDALHEHLGERDEFLKNLLDDIQFYMAECNRLYNALQDLEKDGNKKAYDALARHQKRVLMHYSPSEEDEG